MILASQINIMNTAQNIWKEFDCKNMGDLYFKSNVLLLADYVFGEFKSVFHNNYQLDPA